MKVPITFEYEGKTYKGEFSLVNGTGGLWHLMIDRYYYGQLRYYSDGWRWMPQKDTFIGMDDYFGDYVTAWVG